MKDPITNNERTLQVLADSEMFRDYERAFTEGTGLPLNLHAPEMLNLVRYPRDQESPFCKMMASVNQSCAACYALQSKLEEEAQLGPKTMKCFAGLCETAVPVRVGENLIGFLQTGQILLQQPDKVRFNRVAETLLQWGADVDLKTLEDAYFNTRVISAKQYEADFRNVSQSCGQRGDPCGRRRGVLGGPVVGPQPIHGGRCFLHESDDSPPFHRFHRHHDKRAGEYLRSAAPGTR